jgi:hypothetical protein
MTDPHRLLPIHRLAKEFPQHYAAPSLDSCQGKLGRANEHLQTLRNEIGPFESQHAHTITVEHDADAPQYIFKVHGIAQPKPEWAYIAGDCIHNLRSALDHLVYQLSILGQGGRHLSIKEETRCAFPIESNPDEFTQNGERRIQLLRVGERTRIKELQPFNASDMSIWGPIPDIQEPSRSEPARIPTLLNHLAHLDNIDKHRRVNTTWQSALWYAHADPPEPFGQSSVTAASLLDDAEIGRWGYQGAKPEIPTNLDLKSYFPICIAIGEPSAAYGYGALDLLTWCEAAVERIIDFFRPCVATGSPALPVTDLDRVPLQTWVPRDFH